MKIRTRFAPSPTGFMHVGNVRSALFAWLVARQAKGHFIVRLEDTDKVREVTGSADHIMRSLKWLGLDWDESIDIGGEYGPYRQSERLEIYKQWAEKLIKKGRAYADPYTPEEVQGFRDKAKAEKRPFLFRNHRPAKPPVWDGTQPLRFKSDPQAYTWKDEVMGELSAGPEAVDDFIIMKSDGYPTYNFCHIIDDHLMKCTHVIRAQEYIASVPKYLNLYEALEIERPLMATLPFVMAADGKKKLSKRDGAKDLLQYAEEGYLPETLLCFLATLGWNDGTEQETFTKKELIEKFSLDRVQKSGARFDEQRLLWMNGYFIRQLSVDKLYERTADFWPAESADFDETYKKQVLALIQERLKFFQEIPALTSFFFKDLPVDLDLVRGNKQLKKMDEMFLKDILSLSRDKIAASDFSVEDLSKRLNDLLQETEQKPGILFSLIRIATTQAPASPALAETIAILGKDTTLRRIDAMLAAM